MGAIKVAEGVINSSQYATDKWNKTVAGLKNGWQEFTVSLANLDFSNFTNRMKEAIQAGRDYADVIDLMEKRQAGLTSRHIKENEEIAKLRLSYYDHNKTAGEKADIMKEVIRLTQLQSEEDNKAAQQNFKGYTGSILAAKGIKEADLEAYLLFEKNTEKKVELVERLDFVTQAYKANAEINPDGATTQKFYKEMIALRVQGVGNVARIEKTLSKEQIDQARALYDEVGKTQTAIFENKEGYYRKEEMQLKKEEKAI